LIRILLATLFLSLTAETYSQSTRLLSERELSKLLPQRIKGYSLSQESKTMTVKVGSLTYVLCQHNFTSRGKSIQLLLFDYLEAPIMFSQSLKKWNEMIPVSSDSVFFGKVADSVDHEFHSYTHHGKRAQVVMTIADRFVLHASAEGMTLQELKANLSLIDTSRFPR
jgi:hypothetical protein